MHSLKRRMRIRHEGCTVQGTDTHMKAPKPSKFVTAGMEAERPSRKDYRNLLLVWLLGWVTAICLVLLL